MMKLNIEWNSKVEVFDAVGTIETYSDKRNDIIEILNYIQENGTDKEGLASLFGNKEISYIVVERVLEYLGDCGYVINGNISTKGKEVLRSGKVPVEQRGKFRFWNIEDLGPMQEMYSNGSKLIIGYKRQKENQNKFIHRENANEYKKLKVTMPNSDEEFKVLSLSENHYNNSSFACIKHNNLNKDIKLKLGLSSSNVIDLSVNGNLNGFGNSKITVNNNTVFSEKVIDNELSFYIINILSQCDAFSEYNSRKSSFKLNNVEELIENKVININDLENFKANVNFNNVNIGESIYNLEGNDIPIMPGNEVDAEFWFKKIIERKILNKYMNSEEFDYLLEEFTNKDEFKDYIDKSKIDKSLYISNLKNNKLLRAYWNLQAPRDLQPNANIDELIIDKIDISRGTEMSIEELINKLVGNNKVDELIFSSKYIIKNDQKRKFELFMEALKNKGCDKFNLITQHKFNINNVVIDSYEKIYGSRKNWPHDRYFSLKINEVWHYYKMSAELDQCKYDEEDLNKWSHTTIGKWKDISFYKIDRSIFPLELLKIEENK